MTKKSRCESAKNCFRILNPWRIWKHKQHNLTVLYTKQTTQTTEGETCIEETCIVKAMILLAVVMYKMWLEPKYEQLF